MFLNGNGKASIKSNAIVKYFTTKTFREHNNIQEP